jgi:hypothetical protein
MYVESLAYITEEKLNFYEIMAKSVDLHSETSKLRGSSTSLRE